LGPQLGKLLNMHKLNLMRALVLLHEHMYHVCLTIGCDQQADNKIGKEEACTLGPQLAKLLNIHTLNLRSSCRGLMIVHEEACSVCVIIFVGCMNRQWLR